MKKWLRKWLSSVLYPEDEVERPMKLASSTAIQEDHFGGAKNINLNVYFATGGVVIRSHRYDNKTDRSHHGLYIIREDQDLPQELSKIITVESLK